MIDFNMHHVHKIFVEQVEVTGCHWVRISAKDTDGAEVSVYFYATGENSPVEIEILPPRKGGLDDLTSL